MEKALLLENEFDALNAIDWTKGCSAGQELTAAMKYRALVKRRLVPVTITGPAPAPGTVLTLDGEEAGVMRSSADGIGLALLRLEALEQAKDRPFLASGAQLMPRRPPWRP